MEILSRFFETATPSKSKSESELIEEIHNEFDTAPDRILEEALSIINKELQSKITLESEIEDKAVRLKKLGFIRNGLVDKLESITRRNQEKDEVISMEMETAKRIKYYSETYPFLKFLTINELDRICDKYGLVYAPVGNYKMPVPDKNLEEIENSQVLKYSDECLSEVRRTFIDDSYGEERKKFYRKLVQLFGGNSFTEEELRKLKIKHNLNIPDYRFDDFFWYVARELKSHDDEHPITKLIKETKDYSGLFIAAPKSHFDLSNLKFDDKKGFYKTKIEIKKDPIVFRYVKGGIQVLSKWGLEADDPALQHEILN